MAELGSLAAAKLGDVGPVPEDFAPVESRGESLASARKRIEAQINDRLDEDKLNELLDAALAVKKMSYVDFVCKGCGQKQRQLAEFSDPKTAMDVIEKLLNQGAGRPSEQQPETASLVVNRRVIYSTPEDDDGGGQ